MQLEHSDNGLPQSGDLKMTMPCALGSPELHRVALWISKSLNVRLLRQRGFLPAYFTKLGVVFVTLYGLIVLRVLLHLPVRTCSSDLHVGKLDQSPIKSESAAEA